MIRIIIETPNESWQHYVNAACDDGATPGPAESEGAVAREAHAKTELVAMAARRGSAHGISRAIAAANAEYTTMAEQLAAAGLAATTVIVEDVPEAP